MRTNHYERAFEAYLRAHRVPYVAVDETRRSLDAHGSLKNVDFIVSPSDATPLPLDVKGRRFPSGSANPQYWRNWSTWDDLRGLAAWQEKLGPASCALLVFAYHVVGERAPLRADQLHAFEQRRYAFLGVRVADYVRFARPLSKRWQTVRMPTPVFRQAARPFAELLGLVATG
ncbi:MAG: HYExAFE family protein [Planctomycetota bacterium]